MKIELEHIEKKFPDATPIKDLSATIHDGDIIALIGPSGTGKSTLLRCINLLDPPTKGRILVDGIDITKSRANFEKVNKKMGMVFQSFNLFNHMTVIENVMYAPRVLQKKTKQQAYDIAIKQLRSVGLEKQALKYPDELSGGQKQRVSIARTLAMNPELILMDEPTSALDPTMVREVESVIMEVAKTGKTILIVTHEMRLAKAISNRVFYLDNGELYEEGTPEEIFEHPKRERTKAFINHLKVFKYKFTTDTFDFDKFTADYTIFVENNNLESAIKTKMRSTAEAIATEVIPHYIPSALNMDILAEYNAETGQAKLIVYCSEAGTDIVRKITDCLSPIVSAMDAEKIEDEDYTDKISCTI